MIKKCLLFVFSFMLFILSGCAESSGASAGKIIPPSNQACPLGGTWTVIRELDVNGDTSDATQEWIGSDVQFAEGAVALGGQIWGNLSYKIKRVNAADYLMTKYIPPSCISLPETRTVDVITVYAASNFLGEVMKLDDESMVFFVQNKNLLLRKISDQADSTPGAAYASIKELNQGGNEKTSGVLLGLRIPSDAGYAYRTFWIAADHQQLRPVLAAEQLFFPRTSGFWELNVRNIAAGRASSILTARNVTAKSLEAKPKKKEKDFQGEENEKDYSDQKEGADPGSETDQRVRSIDYIGNDYVAVQKETDGISRLQVLPVDKLSSPERIKIVDLLGDKGLKTYLSARDHAAAALIGKGAVSIERDESGENIGLTRKNGHWLLTGRINYKNREGHEHADFDLKIIPPAGLIYYDTLAISWHKIKDRVPDALDAFTSPNKDIALVRTKNKLTVYRIGAVQLEQKPLADIDLPEGTNVIMAEWATGSYVGNWENSFLSYGAQTISVSSIRVR